MIPSAPPTTIGKEGLANPTATLLDKGTKTKTDVEFAEGLETLGRSISVGASADETSVNLSVLTRNLASGCSACSARS